MRLLTLIILIVFLCFGETQTIFKGKYYDSSGRDFPITWSSTYNAAQFTVAQTYYSKPFNINKHSNGATGLWGVVVQPDTAGGADAEPDSVYFWPEYYTGASTGWLVGDSMIFHQRFDSTITGGYIDTVTVFIDNTHDGTNYFWQSVPADSFLIHSFPYQRVRIGMKIMDATALTHIGIKSEIHFDTRY